MAPATSTGIVSLWSGYLTDAITAVAECLVGHIEGPLLNLATLRIDSLPRQVIEENPTEAKTTSGSPPADKKCDLSYSNRLGVDKESVCST